MQIQIDEKFVDEQKPPPKKRGVRAWFPHGVVRYNIGQVCRHKKYNYVCVVHGWDMKCMASKVRLDDLELNYDILHSKGMDLTDGSWQATQEWQAAIL